jgi:ABC-2 type transport system permease protein
MRRYRAVFSVSLRSQLQYRAAAWAGFGTQTFFGLVRVMAFSAFFAGTSRVQPLDFSQVVTYIWLGQALLLLIPFRIDYETANLIRSGNLAYELARPVNLYGFWLSRAVAMRIGPVIFRCIPMIVLAALVFPLIGLRKWSLGLPVSPGAATLFAVSLCVAFLLAAAISVLTSVFTLWTISSDGANMILPALIWVFSGIVIPLPFYPDWFQPLLYILPFRGMMDIPFRIYLGDIPGVKALGMIFFQLIWTAAVVLLGKELLGKGLRRVVIQGG